jgi:hypothetical protein
MSCLGRLRFGQVQRLGLLVLWSEAVQPCAFLHYHWIQSLTAAINQANYRVDVDGQPVGTGNGTSSPDVFDQLLFGMHLPYGEHSLSLVNLGSGNNNPWLDLDYVVLETGDGNPNTTTEDTFMDDRASNITYTSEWTATPSFRTAVTPGYFNGTGTTTTSPGAAANISFFGMRCRILVFTDLIERRQRCHHLGCDQ